LAFTGKKTRKLSRSNRKDGGDKIIPLQSHVKIITNGHSTAHFERLCYKNCPVLHIEGRRLQKKTRDTELVDMNRRRLVKKVSIVINEMDMSDRSKINIFAQLLSFFRCCDSNDISDIFSEASVQVYIESLVDKYHSGVKGKTLSQAQGVFKSFLKEYDSHFYNICKKFFYVFPDDSRPVEPYTDQELKDISRCLYDVYENYQMYVFAKMIPYKFPLLSSDYLKSRGIVRASTVERQVEAYTNKDQWKYDLSRTAFFIFCFYTGVNTSSLLSLKHEHINSDVFKEVSRGVFKLSIVKGRQAGEVNNIDVGFGRKARDFIKRWIYVSKVISNGSPYLFPKIVNGKCSKMTDSNVSQFSKVFENFGLPGINSQRFRKTKASLIMRTTESIFKVAEGLNNSVETAAQHYSDGDSTTIEFSLASALDVRRRTALGDELEVAKKESGYKFKDPLRERSALIAGQKPTQVSNGLRCLKPFSEKSLDLKKQLVDAGIASDNEKVACYKFLDCFRCSFHAVIAEVQDVWMLLSFQDVILESLSRPALNSMPSNMLQKVLNTIKKILAQIKKEYPLIYRGAEEKYQLSPHPLWSSEDDFELLMNVYS
jgi:hypothetical protein